MAWVYTIEGPRRRKRRGASSSGGGADGPGCRRVRHGNKRGCTIALCPDARGRKRFKKGSVRCG